MGVMISLYTLPFIASNQGRGHLISDTLQLPAGWFIFIFFRYQPTLCIIYSLFGFGEKGRACLIYMFASNVDI